MAQGKVRVYLIAHTHWDREWYYTFDKYRYRLAECIERALAIFKRDPRYHSFTLDGQVVPVDDYLEVRPDKLPEIREAVSSGKLLVGPWVVQPDEFLVSGEGLIRNLLYGIRRAEELGRCMKIGYLPDTFGHTPQLPQILRGFGIDNFVFHRGMGPELEKLGTPFRWRAPDGSEVIALFLVRGYCNCAGLPRDPEKAAKHLLRVYERWKPYLRIPALPAMVGCDHHFPREYIPDVVEALRARTDLPFEVVQGSLEDVIEEARKHREKLGVYEGELLSSHYHWCLYGVWSARTYLKRLYFETESLLVHYVEPFWAIAWLLGFEPPIEFIRLAWRYVLISQGHDPICGCSADEVEREQEVRLLKAKTLAEELLYCTAKHFNVLLYYIGSAGFEPRRHALLCIASKAGLSFEPGAPLYVVAFNPLSWRRRAPIRLLMRPVELTPELLERAKDLVPVELLEALKRCIEAHGAIKLDPRQLKVKAPDGRIIPAQTRELPDGSVELLFVDELPPLGYRAYALVPEGESRAEADLKYGDGWIENEYLKVSFDLERGGVMTIEDKRTGARFEDLLILEDGADAGDEYDYSPCAEDRIIKSTDFPATFEVVERGPAAVTARLRLTMKVPRSLSPDRRRRSAETVDLPVEILVTLYSRVPRVDVKIIVDNRAEDHRLRAVFPTGLEVNHHYAELHFYVTRRPNKATYYYIRKDGTRVPIPTYPTRLWVDVNDGKRGLAVATKGLHEYEVRKGLKGAEIVITLMRCVGWVSRPDLLTRNGDAGPWIPTPDAQCPGRQEFKLCIIPHPGGWLEAGVHRIAREFAIPPMAHECLPHEGELPPEQSFVEVSPPEIVLSAAKKAEDEDALVLRVFNISGKEVEASIRLWRRPKEAWLADLNEKPREPLAITGDTIKVRLPPHRIQTLLVKL